MDFVWVLIVGAGAMNLPVIADVVQQLFPNSGVSRMVQGSIRPVLVGMVLFLSSAALWYFFAFFAYLTTKGLVHPDSPNAAYSTADSFCWMCHTVFAVFLWVNMIANYILVVSCDPGVVQPGWADRFNLTSSSSLFEEPKPSKPTKSKECKKQTSKEAALQSCKKCEPPVLRPPGAHHCRVCSHCVLYMDHHCPFTGGCIGVGNFVYFFCWTCYMAVGLSYACLLSFPLFSWCLFPDAPHDPASGLDVCEWAKLTSLTFLAPLLAWLGVMFLLSFEVYLLYTHQTTIEFLAKTFGRKSQRDRSGGDTVQAHGFRSVSQVKSFSFLVLRGNPWWHLLIPHVRTSDLILL